MTRKKDTRDRLDDANEAATLMVPHAPRDTQKGFVVTGFTFSKLTMSIDVRRIIRGNILALFVQNPGRALRLVDHLRGRRISSYWKGHRLQLREDLDALADSLRASGYPVEGSGKENP